MSHLSKANPILRGAARALFVQAYASRQEERYQAGKRNAKMAGPGEDWMDVAPPTPFDAYLAASWLLAKFGAVNKASIHELLVRARIADNKEDREKRGAGGPLPEGASDLDHIPDDYAESFGHDIAMQAVGHGVGWFDDHARFDIIVPHFEYDL